MTLHSTLAPLCYIIWYMNYAMHFQLIKQQDLEASLAASMSREKETMEQTAALEKEKENLARELASYINKEKEKVHELFIVRSFKLFLESISV